MSGTNEMPQISVIVPAYRPIDFAALRASMAANADADAEWIVVDDGSGAGFDAIFTTLEGSGAHLIRRAQNCGQGAARNAGLMQARGHWIKFLDADDMLDEGHLATLLEQTRDEGAIPFAPTRHVFANGSVSVNESWRGLALTPEVQLARLLHAPFLHHCGALFPRPLLNELGGYDESLVTDEDGDLLIRVLMAENFFLPVERVHYHYIHHAGHNRVSSDRGGAKLAARLRVCEKVEVAFDGRAMPNAIRRGLALRLDKIALAYWHEDRVAANAALARARKLCPSYNSSSRLALRLLRFVGGPGAVIAVARFWRRLRRRPAGGTQG